MMHNSVDNDNVLFLEARLEVTSHASTCIVLDKQSLPAFVYLKCVVKQLF
jgi:hypothetical protein